jgi:hypothetical protein
MSEPRTPMHPATTEEWIDYWHRVETRWRVDEERAVKYHDHVEAEACHRERVRCLQQALDLLEGKSR